MNYTKTALVGVVIASVLMFGISMGVKSCETDKMAEKLAAKVEQKQKAQSEEKDAGITFERPEPAPKRARFLGEQLFKPSTKPASTVTVEPLVLKRTIGPFPCTAPADKFGSAISSLPPDNLLGYYDLIYWVKDPNDKVWIMPDGNPARQKLFPDAEGKNWLGDSSRLQFKSATGKPTEVLYAWQVKKEYAK